MMNIDLDRGKLVKKLRDERISFKAISEQLGLSVSRVRGIEAQYLRHLAQIDNNPLYGLSTRSMNCILNHFDRRYNLENGYSNYPTKKEVLELKVKDFLEMPNLGKPGFIEIMEWLIK